MCDLVVYLEDLTKLRQHTAWYGDLGWNITFHQISTIFKTKDLVQNLIFYLQFVVPSMQFELQQDLTFYIVLVISLSNGLDQVADNPVINYKLLVVLFLLERNKVSG